MNGYTQHPLEGVSFVSTFDDADATTGKETQFYSMLGTRAIWHQGWKAAALSPAAPNAWASFAQQRWELFDTEHDPSECHDLADQHPDKLQELIALWWTEAGKYQALPLESRDAIEIFMTERPQLAEAPQPLRLLPRLRRSARVGGAQHPQSLLHDRRRSRPSTPRKRAACCSPRAPASADMRSTSRTAELKYVYNWVGEFEQMVEADEPIPTGHVVFSASFDKEGDAMPTEGTLSLYIRDRKVGEGKIKTQPGKFSLAGEGLNVGKEGAEPVTDDYPGQSPWPFVGGTIKRVFVDVSGEPFVDLAREAAMVFARE